MTDPHCLLCHKWIALYRLPGDTAGLWRRASARGKVIVFPSQDIAFNAGRAVVKAHIIAAALDDA